MKRILVCLGAALALSSTAYADSGLVSGLAGRLTAPTGAALVQYSEGDAGSVAQSVAAKLQQHLNAADFGVLCNGTHDDTAGFNAADAAAKNRGGATIDVPATSAGCLVSGTITLDANVTLAGQGPGASHLLAATTNLATLLMLNGNAAQVRDLDIVANHAGTNTSGTAILYGNWTNLATRNVTIEGPCVGIDVNGNTTFVDAVAIRGVVGSTCRGIRVGLATTQAGTVDARITNTTIASLTSNRALADLEVIDAGGLYLSNNDFLYATHGTLIDPGTNNVVQWPFFSNTVLGDTTGTDSLDIAPVASSSGIVEGMMCQGCWIASSASGAGLNIGDGSGNVTGIHFVGARIYGNYANGANIHSGTDITLDASAFCNNNIVNNGSGSISLDSGVNDFSVRNSKLGGACDTNGATAAEYYSVNLGGSNSAITITGNDMSGTAAGLVGATPMGNSVIANNAGFDQVIQTVASATTITLNVDPSAQITGTTTISTIAGGWNARAVRLIPLAGGLNFATGGNICNATTASAYTPITAWYDAPLACWVLK